MGAYFAHLISDTSPAAASAVVGDTVRGLGQYDAIVLLANLTGATGGALDVYLQASYDDGTTWTDYAHFPQLAAAAAPRWYHLGVPPGGETIISLVGSGVTPALAANKCVGGPWSNMLRAVYVAGTGTTLGASQTIKIIGWKAQK